MMNDITASLATRLTHSFNKKSIGNSLTLLTISSKKKSRKKKEMTCICIKYLCSGVFSEGTEENFWPQDGGLKHTSLSDANANCLRKTFQINNRKERERVWGRDGRKL